MNAWHGMDSYSGWVYGMEGLDYVMGWVGLDGWAIGYYEMDGYMDWWMD
jgi:hypothetical protein